MSCEGWESVAIGDLVDYAVGGGWGEEDDGEHPVLVIRGTDIPAVRSGDLSTCPRRFEERKKAEKRSLTEGDIVFEISGGSQKTGQSTGRPALITSELINEANCTVIPASFCRLMRFKQERVLPSFVYYHLLNLHLSGRAADYEVQSTGISNFQFKEFLRVHPVSLPPLPEQRRIAWVLGTLDEKIELNQRMARTLEETAAAIFKARFVNFEGVEEFEDSEVGPIPKGWKVTSLETFPGLSIVKPGLDSQRYGVTDVLFDYVATGDVSGHAITGSDQVDLDTKPSRANMQPGFDRVWFAKMKASTKYLWTMRVHDAYWKSKILSTGFAGLQADTDELASFLFGLISSEEFEARKDQGATGTTMEAVNNDWIKNYPVLKPPASALQEFDRRTRPLMTQYWSNLLEGRTLAALRDELLPKLISGKIRVPEGVGPDLDEETATEAAEELAEA